MAKETKKTNKKTLGAVFCALSLGVAGVTGLMLNDSNKKFDELKKDNAVQIEQYKTEKTALQTQLATKQAQLQQLQEDASVNASQIETLQQEIQTLENQLLNYENISKTVEDMTIVADGQDLWYHTETGSYVISIFSGQGGGNYKTIKDNMAHTLESSFRYSVYADSKSSAFSLQDVCYYTSNNTTYTVTILENGVEVSDEFLTDDYTYIPNSYNLDTEVDDENNLISYSLEINVSKI